MVFHQVFFLCFFSFLFFNLTPFPTFVILVFESQFFVFHLDITPTGSLRRRRSRVLSEEDDNNLMDFLRSSSANENNSRERKTSSYGSLDRSWARRARSGSNSKKRPDLLNIDFSLERERPVSPANLDTANRIAHEDARPR